MIYNTFIYNPIRPDYIFRCLESLYQHTDMTNNRVIVVDQTLDGLQLPMDKVHMVIRPYRNLGFSKSMNEGIIHALRWGSRFITCANDDIEYIDSRWWSGIEKTFENYGEKVMAVNPMSPKEPGWGYGLDHNDYLTLIEYKKEFTSADYDFLLACDFSEAKKRFNPLFEAKGRPNTYPEKKNGVIDAIATWHTTFKREHFSEVGLFEERFYPGGWEDYDMDARTYRKGLRMIGTTLSWVWHHWGSSKDRVSEHQGTSLPILDQYRWMNPTQLYPPEKNGGQNPDPWGKWTNEKGEKIPLYRDPTIGIIEI